MRFGKMKGTPFKITRRHFDIIIKQGYDNYPEECGGFFGGKDNIVKALLPVLNKMEDNKRHDKFMVLKEDMERAYLFFQKHNLDYFGLYHTHPQGVSDPSAQDLKHFQKYLLIVSYQDFNKPDFAIWEVRNHQPFRCPIHILEAYDVKDIHASSLDESVKGVSDQEFKSESDKIIKNCVVQNWDELSLKLGGIIHEQENIYKKLPSHHPDSDFSTLA